ncbi:FAD binding domain-containing protein [Amanita rubescens]|nr:FAD binding domain-containing protein [Amanita rubescens]
MLPASLSKSSQVDVLIIGAGPAGLMACNALARAGVKVRIIDQRATRIMAGQADGIQPRTIEVLQSYGLGERLLKEENQMHCTTFYEPGPDGGIQMVDMVPDITAPTARYPFEITSRQGVIEATFLDSIRTSGVEVDRAIVPTSIHISKDPKLLQDSASYPVQVTLKHLNAPAHQPNTEVVNAKFVLGTDGAHSWVRKSLGIQMEGEQAESVWGVVDMKVELHVETDFPHARTKAAIHSNNGSCIFIPREDDLLRLYVQLGSKDAIDDTTGRVDKSKLGPDDILEVASESLKPYTIKKPKEYQWWTLYQVGQRVASRYSMNERVFIAGDACHTHSPKAGQGMNASMNDTHNLAWKLAYVIRGWADLSLLKTYEYERRKYAQDLIAFDRKWSHLFSSKPRTENNKEGVSHEVFRTTFQTFGGFTSGIGVHYADSAIVNSKYQSYTQHLIIGERVPPQILVRAADGRPYELQDLLPSDTRFKVLVFAGNTLSADQLNRLNVLASEVFGEDGILRRYVPRDQDISSAFDVLTVSTATLKTVRVGDLPELLRPRWSKVFVDDKDIVGRHGGGAYDKFGINPNGAVVIVRPDGYVGMVAPFDGVHDVDVYFSSFMSRA